MVHSWSLCSVGSTMDHDLADASHHVVAGGLWSKLACGSLRA